VTGEPFSLPTFTMAEYNLYRLDDRIFWSLLIAGMIFCLIHAARRAFRQPLPMEPAGKESNSIIVKEEAIQRHTLFQRIFHWSNAAAVIVLAISGWMIYRLPSPGGTAFVWFFWHRWAVALLLVGSVFHSFYEGFVVRGLNPMAVNQTEAGRILAILKNFFGLSKSYPLATKYHPGQIFFHWVVAGNLFLLILTGFVIWKPFRNLLPLSLFGLGWDFIFYNRLFHGFFSATLIASLFGHIYFALLIKKNWTETKSMFTGHVSLHDYLRSHSLIDPPH
jgi:cytochrome b subunit of formate dehydrogenase